MTFRATSLACVRGRRTLFADVAFELKPGEALRVAGRNGSGKTSLLRVLCGLVEPSHGEVCWQGRPIGAQREAFHRALRYMGHGCGLKDDLSALENVQTSVLLRGMPCAKAQALAALDKVGLAARAGLPARMLSQGQRRRVLLAQLALTPRTSLLVLDEPFNALDQEATVVLSDWLARQLDEGATLVYTTHQFQKISARQHHELTLGQEASAGLA